MKTYIKSVFVVLSLLASLIQIQTARAVVAFTITPAAVSNTYSGAIALSVSGLTSGDTVVVQGYLDANTNGIIDAGDVLWQQFQLTDGQQSLYYNNSTVVTNFNVPGDTDGTANGTIAAKMVFQPGSPQAITGKYVFRLYSPANHFTPITNNLFMVTNFPYPGSFTGNVVSNGTATTLSNAIVLLFNAAGGNLNVVGGAVANNAGSYTITAPPGIYTLAAIKSNYMADTTVAANLALGATSITTNLNLLVATQSISGRIVDANNSSLGIAGFLVPAQTQGGLLTVAFTDTNGNFTERVNANQWRIENNEQGLAAYGYLGLQNSTNVDTTGGSVSGVTNAVPKGTAIFYGSVKDNLNQPLVGISLSAQQQDNNYQYESQGGTDANGNYVAGALAGNWSIGVPGDGSPTNYVFSQQSNTVLTNGQAYLQNFTAYLATNHITGHVTFNGSPVTNVQVSANANIGPNNYQAQAYTDNSGFYSLNVVNTNIWNVNVSCSGGDSTLDSILGSGNYVCPNSVGVAINNNNGTANFTILPGGSGQLFGYIKDTTGTPVGNVSVSAQDQSSNQGYGTSTDGNGYYSFGTVSYGTYDISVDCGGLSSLGYQCLADVITNFASSSVEVDFTAQFTAAPLQITTASLPNGTNTVFYSQTLQASGGTPPYSWSIPSYSLNPPANLSLSPSGVLSGTLSASANTYYYFDVVVTDAADDTAELDALPLFVVNPPLPPLVITNISFPNGNVGAAYNAQLGATGGLSPYYWQIASGSASPPPGLTLASSGLINGTPTTNGLFSFKVQATDANSTVTNKVFGIIIHPKPVLGLPTRLAGQFQMLLTGASNQNYTVQMSTNLGLGPWSSLFVTNNTTTSSFNVVDPNATNQQRFYRILIGP
jgi:hypothetical protein